MSTRGGIWKALERGIEISCDVVQFFVKNNMQWFGKPFLPEDLALYANQLAKGKLACAFGHSGYLINLAAPPCENRQKSIRSLVQEIQFATALGLPFLVLHPGAHMGAGEDAGIQRAAEGLNEVIRATADSPVRIALENTAGQGSCLGSNIGHLSSIYARVSHPQRIGICLDTAHFFAAGYDIRAPRGWDAAIAEIETMIGLGEVLAFHLNDSKTGLGSRVDRHEHIGKGQIGLEAFRHIVNDQRFENHPGCLETPKSDDLHEDVENLASLRALLNPAKAKRPRTR
jgi:deoxyribonuclease IV